MATAVGLSVRDQNLHQPSDRISRKKVTWEDGASSISGFPPHGYPSQSLEDLTRFIINEIENVVMGESDTSRQNTLIFQVVSGGNIEVVRSVFRALTDGNHPKAASWLTGREVISRRSSPDSASNETCHGVSKIEYMKKMLLYVLTLLVFVVTTPVFYGLHTLTIQLSNARRRRISKDIQLPLVYALLSEEPEMVKLFLDNGCQLDSEDEHGNNVYHYLADVSLDDPDKATSCHEIIISLVDDITLLKKVIMKNENHQRLTPWESMAKFGSLYLFKHIGMDQCGMGSRILSVSSELLWAKLPGEHWSQVDNELLPSPSPELENRTILQEDHKHPALIDVWEFDIRGYSQGDIFRHHSYPLQILTSRSVELLSEKDAGSLLTFSLLWKWMNKKVRHYLIPCIAAHVLSLSVTVVLLLFIIQHGGDMNTSPLAAPLKSKYVQEVQKISQSISKHSHYLPEQNISLANLAALVLNIESCAIGHVSEGIAPDLDNTYGGLDRCKMTFLQDIRSQCSTLSMGTIAAYVSNVDHRKGDFAIRLIIYLFIGFGLFLDVVTRILFLCANFNWKSAVGIDSLYPVISRSIPGSYMEKQMCVTVYALYVVGVYVGLQFQKATHVLRNDYTEFQSTLYLNDSLESRAKLASIGHQIQKRNRNMDTLEQVGSTIIVVCLLVRFIQLINALRLVPGVGFFIITTRKMSKHLAQFTVIFVIVSMAFATVFFLAMKEPECPALQLEDFRSLMSSLFTIYQVFLGYGEYDFSININARLAYIAYTVTTVVLLLNLVIAVMTTTVEELNRTPWKQVMGLFEGWDEILGTEATVLTIMLPFRYAYDKIKKVLQIKDDVSEKTRFEIVCWSNFEGAHSTFID